MKSHCTRLTRVLAFGAGLLVAGTAFAQQKLVLYSTNDATVNKVVVEGFTKATGINVDVVATGSGVIARRIASEAANPQADVVWGLGATMLRLASPHLQPYQSPAREAIQAQFRDPDALWLGTNIQVVVMSRNTKAIDKDAGPKTWSDLLDPKWKGRLALTDPTNSGFTYAAASMLLSLWGDNDKAWSNMNTLLSNARVLNRSTQVFDGIGSGEYPLGISLEYAAFLWAHNGAPVSVVYPTDGTTAFVEGAGILKGAPNLEAAKKFVDYLGGKEAQEALLKTAFRRPARQDIDIASLVPGMVPFSTIKILPYDDTKWENARRETLAKLKTSIQNTR